MIILFGIAAFLFSIGVIALGIFFMSFMHDKHSSTPKIALFTAAPCILIGYAGVIFLS